MDRVLNDRSGVSARTRQLVHSTARIIGYLPDVAPEVPLTKLVAFLPQGTNEFIDGLRGHMIAEAAAMPGVELELPKITQMDARAMAQALSEVGDVQGVALVALSHPRVHDALSRVAARNIPVVTLLSDLPDTLRRAYVGIDNLRAGRLAGEVITRFLGPNPTGKVAHFAGSLTYRGHQERDVGLRQYLAEEAPGLDLLELRESGDDGDRAHAQATAKLAQHPEICAIYNAGGGTGGIARALHDSGRAQSVIFVAHDVTDTNKGFLLDGTLDAIIDQDAKREAQETLAALVAAAQGHPHTPSQLRLHLVLKENIPSDGRPPPFD
ncbi:MAG: LacI family DNA-binding transcriptional regulator [Gymnodinialimonas sp.]